MLRELSNKNTASYLVRERLERVAQLLPMAAMQASESSEYVHQLRVATREAISAIDAFHDQMPGKPAVWLRKKFKKIRSAAGAARDLDVMLDRYQNRGVDRSVMRALRRSRRRAQKPLMQLHSKLKAKNRMHRRIQQSLRTLLGKPDFVAREIAFDRARQATQDFFDATPDRRSQDSELHRYRIRAKQLRYTLELMEDLHSDDGRPQVLSVVCKIQKKLGVFNDHVVAKNRFTQMKEAAKSRRAKRQLKRLIRRERELVEHHRKHFLEWCKTLRLDSTLCVDGTGTREWR